MSKKVIAIGASDIHLNIWPHFNENNRRLTQSLDQLRLLSRVCRKHNVPLLFTGDLYHKPKEIPNLLISQSLLAYKRYFEDKGIGVYGIDGNHDFSDKNGLESKSPSYLDAYQGLFDTFYQIKPGKPRDLIISKDMQISVHGIPYLNGNIGFEDEVRRIKKSFHPGRKNILLIHTDLPGARDADGRIIDSCDNITTKLDKLFKGFDLVLSGHIHMPQKLGKNIYMLGALQQQTRKDKNCLDMGYWEIYNDFSVKMVKVDIYPQFKTYPVAEPKPDNFHFYDPIIELVEVEEDESISFNTDLSRDTLVNNYFKSQQIKHKARKNLLINLLNEA